MEFNPYKSYTSGFQRGYLLFLSENGTVYEFSTLFYIDFPG